MKSPDAIDMGGLARGEMKAALKFKVEQNKESGSYLMARLGKH